MEAERDLEGRVIAALGRSLPRVELLELTLLPAQGGILRLVVDHPDGVDHEVCAQVTHALEEAGLLERYGAEVWSPGPEPPLRTPEHFRRAIGRRVRLTLAGGADAGGAVTGTLVGVGDRTLRLSQIGSEREIPFAEVRRARALEESEAVG